VSSPRRKELDQRILAAVDDDGVEVVGSCLLGPGEGGGETAANGGKAQGEVASGELRLNSVTFKMGGMPLIWNCLDNASFTSFLS